MLKLEAMTSIFRSFVMLLAIPALLASCRGSDSDPGNGVMSGGTGGSGGATGGSTNTEVGGSGNEGTETGGSGNEGTGTGGSANGGKGGKGTCPDPGATESRTFCLSDGDCDSTEHCDPDSCFPSSCSCSEGVWTCTSDCRRVCAPLDGAGGATGAAGESGS